MSIISREAELKYPAAIPGMDPTPLRSGYMDGADREWTDAEIEAGATALAETLDNANWWRITPHQRFMYKAFARSVLDAARAEAVREEAGQ